MHPRLGNSNIPPCCPKPCRGTGPGKRRWSASSSRTAACSRKATARGLLIFRRRRRGGCFCSSSRPPRALTDRVGLCTNAVAVGYTQQYLAWINMLVSDAGADAEEIPEGLDPVLQQVGGGGFLQTRSGDASPKIPAHHR